MAGSHAIFPWSSDISIAGKIKDQIDAAIITPDANPNNSFSTILFILFLIKNTIAAPKVVPAKGINNPKVSSIFFLLYLVIFLFCAPYAKRAAKFVGINRTPILANFTPIPGTM